MEILFWNESIQSKENVRISTQKIKREIPKKYYLHHHRIQSCETGIILVDHGELMIFDNIIVFTFEQVVTGSFFQS